MAAFDTAMRRVKTIPPDVLKQAFMPRRYDPAASARRYDYNRPASLETAILDKIVEQRVLPDIDLYSGTEISLLLNEAVMEPVDAYNAMYRFSEQQTGGRTITSPLEITYGYGQGTLVGSGQIYNPSLVNGPMTTRVAQDLLSGMSNNGMWSTTYIQLIDHNTILVNDVRPVQRQGLFRCLVSNDPRLNNLDPRYQQEFAELVLLATRSYIYTNLLIDIDEGQLKGGQTIGRFREVVDSYADSETIYQEKLQEWIKIGIMNDPQQYRKVKKMALGIRPKF